MGDLEHESGQHAPKLSYVGFQPNSDEFIGLLKLPVIQKEEILDYGIENE
jgi:hypothetical protein